MKKPIKILIVEDEVIIAQFLQMELEDEGYDVCGFVSSGEEAISKANECKPDLILMDIYLRSNFDGIEAAKQIIKNNKTSIIFMTGYEIGDFIERAQKIDCTTFIEKPIDIIDLKDLIVTTLAKDCSKK